MERQRIKDQIGALEEQLELLQSIALRNERNVISSGGAVDFREDSLVAESLATLRNLHDLVQEQTFLKSLPAQEFLHRVIGILVREARELGVPVAIATHGTGRISLEMVEISMGAIMACIRSSLKGFHAMDRGVRAQKQLFPTFSLYLEVKATLDEVHFRLSDDGMGAEGSLKPELGTEQQYQRIRSHIARHGGWLRRRSYHGYGSSIELKMPLAQSRFECLPVKIGGCEVLLPASCVAEIRQRGAGQNRIPESEVTASLEEPIGLVPALASTASSAQAAVRLTVADFQFWLLCDSVGNKTRARKYPAEGLTDSGTWFQNFGIFNEEGVAKLLPLVEGDALLRFHLATWGSNESD